MMASLDHIIQQIHSLNGDGDFLKSFLSEKPMDSLFKVYEKIEVLLSRQLPEPITLCAKSDATEAYDLLRCHHFISDAEELVRLLAKPHLKALLQCHDIIANKVYDPELPEVPYEVDEDDVSVKIINLVKHNEPLGATIKINERNGAVLVARVMHGGSADRSGALSVGDEIQEINHFSLNGRDPMEVIKMLTSISGELNLKLCPSSSKKNPSDQNEAHIRALFSYSPALDQLIPCREAGLSFRRGDILRLVNTEDPHWWQAVKVESPVVSSAECGSVAGTSGLNVGRVGLIPSRTLQENIAQYRRGKGVPVKGKNTTPECVTYEEVDKYFVEEGNYRPIVLVGPHSVGKNELKRQLINTDPEHFKEPIRITTREPEVNEVHGQDFLFVTREEFDTFQQADSLIDQYEISTDQYGLCLDAVLEVIQAGQVAVFVAQPHYLRFIKTSSVKPFVIYIKPPTLDVLQETRDMVQETVVCEDIDEHFADAASNPPQTKSSHHRKAGFTENDLKEMLQAGSRSEVTYGHLFDHIILNDDLPVALEQLSELAYRLETEPFWIPKGWLVEDMSATSSTT